MKKTVSLQFFQNYSITLQLSHNYQDMFLLPLVVTFTYRSRMFTVPEARAGVASGGTSATACIFFHSLFYSCYLHKIGFKTQHCLCKAVEGHQKLARLSAFAFLMGLSTKLPDWLHGACNMFVVQTKQFSTFYDLSQPARQGTDTYRAMFLCLLWSTGFHTIFDKQ